MERGRGRDRRGHGGPLPRGLPGGPRRRGRSGEAIDLMDRSFREIGNEEPDEDLAMLAAQLGRFLFFEGKTELAAERLEVALDIAEALWLPEVLSQALNTKSLTLQVKGRQR